MIASVALNGAAAAIIDISGNCVSMLSYGEHLLYQSLKQLFCV